MNCIVEAWDEHEPALRRYLLGKLDDSVLVEDLLQDVFIKVLRQGTAFCDIEQPRAWLFRVARNTLVDYFRRRPSLVELPDSLPQAVKELPAVESLAACLPKALSLLDEQDQNVIECCDLQGMTQADYARQAGLSLAGAKSRIQRARTRLKIALSSACGVLYDETGNVCCHDSSKCPPS